MQQTHEMGGTGGGGGSLGWLGACGCIDRQQTKQISSTHTLRLAVINHFYGLLMDLQMFLFQFQFLCSFVDCSPGIGPFTYFKL